MNNRFGRFCGLSSGKSQSRYQPYSELALIYDRIMDHVDYTSWAHYIDSIIDCFVPDARNILETACGTGSLSIELHKCGYSMTCMDISHSMLKRAAEKFSDLGMPLNFFEADMKSLPLAYQFDAIICLYDSINYLKEPEYLLKALNEAASCLKDGGLFIFDVCTVKNSEIFFKDSGMVEHFGDITCERKCRFDTQKRIQENHFIIDRPGFKRIEESHYQKIYLLKEIDDLIRETPFIGLGKFDDMSFVNGSEESERVHYVLKKKKTD